MKEEDVLLQKLGKSNAFKVPEGYFENFTMKLIQCLPEKEALPKEKPVTTWMKVRPWVYMAAMFIGAALMIRALQFTKDDASKNAKAPEITQEKYIDETLSNTRMDSYQLYTFLSEAPEENTK